jgi:hypothetical protein
MTCKKSQKNFSLSMSTKKGSKFHNFTNSCFWGPPVANFLTLYNWARANFPNVLAEILWSFLPGAPQAWGPSFLGTQTPFSYATGYSTL